MPREPNSEPNAAAAAPPAPEAPALLDPAASLYGGDQAAPAAPAAEPETPPAAGDDTIEGRDPASPAASPGEDDTVEGGDGEPGPGQAEGEAIETLAELAETQDWDPEWLQGLKVAVKIDGKPAAVPLKDLVDGYQMREAAAAHLKAANTEADEIREAAIEAGQDMRRQLSVANKLMERVEQQLAADVKEIDWDHLRQDDPGEYAAKKEEVAARRAALAKMKEDAAAEFDQAVQAGRDKATEDFKAYRRDEHAKLLAKFPDWQDPEKAEAARAKLVEYLQADGFSADEIRMTTDHRLIVMAHKAMQYDEIMRKGQQASKKRVVPRRPTLTPGNGAAKPPAQNRDTADILYG